MANDVDRPLFGLRNFHPSTPDKRVTFRELDGLDMTHLEAVVVGSEW